MAKRYFLINQTKIIHVHPIGNDGQIAQCSPEGTRHLARFHNDVIEGVTMECAIKPGIPFSELCEFSIRGIDPKHIAAHEGDDKLLLSMS